MARTGYPVIRGLLNMLTYAQTRGAEGRTCSPRRGVIEGRTYGAGHQGVEGEQRAVRLSAGDVDNGPGRNLPIKE